MRGCRNPARCPEILSRVSLCPRPAIPLSVAHGTQRAQVSHRGWCSRRCPRTEGPRAKACRGRSRPNKRVSCPWPSRRSPASGRTGKWLSHRSDADRSFETTLTAPALAVTPPPQRVGLDTRDTSCATRADRPSALPDHPSHVRPTTRRSSARQAHRCGAEMSRTRD